MSVPAWLAFVARTLAVVERRMPGQAARAKRWFVQYFVPFNRRIGLRVAHVAPDSSHVVVRSTYHIRRRALKERPVSMSR
jgi:hypothetical protein